MFVLSGQLRALRVQNCLLSLAPQKQVQDPFPGARLLVAQESTILVSFDILACLPIDRQTPAHLDQVHLV